MGLPRYIVNWTDLTNKLKNNLLDLIEKELGDKYPNLDTTNLKKLLQECKALLPYVKYKGLEKKIQQIIRYKCEGKQKSEGKLMDIPPINNKFKTKFSFDQDVLITGLTINQSGWNRKDKFDLIIDNETIINNATIKEVGEHKYLNVFYPVIRDVPISFILQNNSGYSRQLTIDLDYIEGKMTPILPPLPPPPKPPLPPETKKNEDVGIIIPARNKRKGVLGINTIGYINVPEGTEKLVIQGDFSNITGFQWPDLNVIYEDNTDFGYNSDYCDSKKKVIEKNCPLCKQVTYTGWGSPIERFTFINPRAGRWIMQGRGLGAKEDSKVKIKCNMDWVLLDQKS